jgi:C-terminal processing protease CtpA/Prc
VAYFPAQKTGRVIGERTGGVNGNVVAATLPSGLAYLFTGMRVTRHDGSDMHIEGFQPDDVVVPTLEGIRAGKDDVLERALFEATR